MTTQDVRVAGTPLITGNPWPREGRCRSWLPRPVSSGVPATRTNLATRTETAS
jgi:hypothetical protein